MFVRVVNKKVNIFEISLYELRAYSMYEIPKIVISISQKVNPPNLVLFVEIS